VTSQFITNGFVVLTVAAQAGLLAIMVKRGKRSEFPVFFWYNAMFAVISLVLLAVYSTDFAPTKYFYLYWALNSALMLAELCVMYEIFVKALKPYSGLIDLGKMLFRWAVAFLVLAAAITSFATHNATIDKCFATTNQLERSLRLVQCGLLLLFFIFERRLGLAWRSPVVLIGLGLGLSASINLSASFLLLRMPKWAPALDYVDYIQSLAIVLFWAVCMYMREPDRKTIHEAPSKLIFQRWNDVLVSSRFGSTAAATASIGVDSFLPNVEQTVERILARKMVQ
jgi:hypothetical protein